MRERTPFPKELIDQLPNLKLLLTTGVRNASLELPAFKERGIPVAGATVPSDSTTQHTIALILSLARNLTPDDRSVKSGGWQTSSAIGLTRKYFGVLGLGKLGLAAAKIMHQAFGMKIIAWSSNLTQEAADEKAASAGFPVQTESGEKTFKVVSKEELFKQADILSVHLVLSDRSRGIVSAKDLELLKPDAMFVNTSRGPLVVEKDLLDLLKKGKIRSAALDVFGIEPLPLDSEWRTTKWGENGSSDVLLSPHMGYVEKDVLSRWYSKQVQNIIRWEKGEALAESLI